MSKPSSLQRFNHVLLAFLLVFAFLKLTGDFIIPILIGGLFAMMLLPVSRKLEQYGVSRGISALICVFAVIIVLSGVITVFINQLGFLGEDLPNIGKVLNQKIEGLLNGLAASLGISPAYQDRYLKLQLNDLLNSVGGYITTILRFTGTLVFKIILTMVYAFFFMLYRRKLKNFVYMLIVSRIKDTPHPIIGATPANPGVVIDKIIAVASSYVAGSFLVILILSALNIGFLFMIGLEHALFFGLLAGILNLIPYVGSIGGSAIPVLFALLTKESGWYPLGIAIYFLVTQLIESYVLTPNITGARVKLNPLITLSGILFGGFIWGIAGMILFIPYLGILKVIFDHVKKLRPYGYLMGKDPGVDVTA